MKLKKKTIVKTERSDSSLSNKNSDRGSGQSYS